MFGDCLQQARTTTVVGTIISLSSTVEILLDVVKFVSFSHTQHASTHAVCLQLCFAHATGVVSFRVK